jgi:hypothetical protein
MLKDKLGKVGNLCIFKMYFLKISKLKLLIINQRLLQSCSQYFLNSVLRFHLLFRLLAIFLELIII